MQTSKGISTVFVVALIIILTGASYYLFSRKTATEFPPPDGTSFCTQDAKLCPDGSYVGRIPPSCDFSPCPSATSSDETAADAVESIAVGEPYPYQGNILAGDMALSPLIDFNKTDYERALASDKLIVLYFYANWCPICKAETETALYPAFDEFTGDSVIGFRVNFKDDDTDKDEEAIAKEFNVTYQHTKVFVKNGERVVKAPDSWDKDRYLSEIAAY